MSELKYQNGFGNHFETEAIAGTLPVGQNSPQKVARGLYAEQLSGSAFTASRSENLRSWLYRMQPSVVHTRFDPIDSGLIRSRPFNEVATSPNPMRWDPFPSPSQPTDFLDGLITLMGNGREDLPKGCAVHVYAINQPMENRFFFSSESEFLFVPQEGTLQLKTELGILEVAPGEIAVIPKGIKYQALPTQDAARGYICENYGIPFRLPYLGPIGSNGLANPRDFKVPVAYVEKEASATQLITKFQGKLWRCSLDHSPLDVVAWHGNYAPYKYDLAHFQAVTSVSFDHCDPSIFTVLTSPSEFPGVANVDFVIFPPRWLTMEHTFRPPYFHRNIMSEFMGLVHGVYDAKASGFLPGGASLHNSFTAHGPDAETTEKAETKELKPEFVGSTLAFMFESSLPFQLTRYASQCKELQKNYQACWSGLKRR